MTATTFNKQIFWDYDMENADLDDPKVKKWYLKRKIDFGDFSDIKGAELRKYLPELDIDSSMKELIHNYLYPNEQN